LYVKKAGILSLAVGAVAAGTLALATPAMAAAPVLTVTPHLLLTNGKSVKVAVKNYPAAQKVYVLQCSKVLTAAMQAQAGQWCNLKNIASFTTSSTGAGSVAFKVVAGQVGSNTASQCSKTHACFIGAAALSKPPVGKFAKITFK
jgi:hypothetical protein